MRQPFQSFRFRIIYGMWQETTGYPRSLADFLAERNLLIDDRTMFARIYDYEEGVCYWYRVNGGLITIDVWKISDK